MLFRSVYLRKWLPELAKIPDRHLHAPWEAAPEQLQQADLVLGKDYPLPLVDLKRSRKRALSDWDGIKTIGHSKD